LRSLNSGYQSSQVAASRKFPKSIAEWAFCYRHAHGKLQHAPVFVGHYGATFLLKKKYPHTPFWALLIGVQFVDVLLMIFIMFGIEKIRFVPGFTETNPWDSFFMPYSHSLVASFVWSAIVMTAVWLLFKKKFAEKTSGIALAIGLSVFSHFILDFFVHTPDLPLLGDDSMKVGLGLWRYLEANLIVESTFLVLCLLVYLRGNQPGESAVGKYGMHGLVAFMIVANSIAPFMPIPGSVYEFAMQALFAYFLFAFLGAYFDKKRIGYV